jgi:hypothetical protein
MPFRIRQSQKLVKIATHPVLAATANHLKLPSAVDSLSLLASVDPGNVRTGIAIGEVTYHMSISDAKRFALEHPDYYSVHRVRRRRSPQTTHQEVKAVGT